MTSFITVVQNRDSDTKGKGMALVGETQTHGQGCRSG